MRVLQDGAAQSEFGLEVGLQGINGIANSRDEGSGGSGSAIVDAVLVSILLVAGCGLGFLFCTRRDRKEETEETWTHHSSAASVNSSQSH